jgi:hypothetical protein
MHSLIEDGGELDVEGLVRNSVPRNGIEMSLNRECDEPMRQYDQDEDAQPSRCTRSPMMGPALILCCSP